MTVAEPVYTPLTERFWSRLPEVYRTFDSQLGWPFKRWLSCILDQADPLEQLIDRIDYVSPADGGAPGDTSDLVDPATADVAWLSWLAQLRGVRLDAGLSELAQRDAVANASSGWRAGTKSAVAAAAMSALTGTRYAAVYDHSTAAGLGTGGVWDVLIVTRSDETPGGAASVIDAVNAKRAKPAGVTLYAIAYEASWAQLQAAYPTWQGFELRGSWAQIEQTGLS